jgi:hypothetical protein
MILFGYSNEDTNDEERRKGWVGDRRPNVAPSAKRQARTLSQGHATTSIFAVRLERPNNTLNMTTLHSVDHDHQSGPI